MIPTQGTMLQTAGKIDRANQAVVNQPVKTPVKATEPLSAEELELTDGEQDPFGYNTNNRAVAERISKLPYRPKSNEHPVSYGGDPAKAAADVALSKKINPDVPANVSDELPPVRLSPDETKAVNEGTDNIKPAVWTPPGAVTPKANPAAPWKPNA